MKVCRRKEYRQSIFNRQAKRPFKLLSLLYLMLLIILQTTSSTNASFQDVTITTGTISVDNEFEKQRESEDLSTEDEKNHVVDNEKEEIDAGKLDSDK